MSEIWRKKIDSSEAMQLYGLVKIPWPVIVPPNWGTSHYSPLSLCSLNDSPLSIHHHRPSPIESLSSQFSTIGSGPLQHLSNIFFNTWQSDGTPQHLSCHSNFNLFQHFRLFPLFRPCLQSVGNALLEVELTALPHVSPHA